MSAINKLVLIGNGFDLAHGLKTSYKNFLDWYMCEGFEVIKKKGEYYDSLMAINRAFAIPHNIRSRENYTSEEVESVFESNDYRSREFRSGFFQNIRSSFKNGKWVDIEYYYFKTLKNHFSNSRLQDQENDVRKLNSDFNFIIKKLTEYIITINKTIIDFPKLSAKNSDSNFNYVFSVNKTYPKIKSLNFNYTEILYDKEYADESDIIHRRAKDATNNPIIFGYGDETDPAYQSIEDSGENMYLEHIKSFGYFKTSNFYNLISYIDSALYTVYIVGHSCGLSDRVLLNQIFEHPNCQEIEVFYYQRPDGTDNFTEITQEISRHFKPQNKGLMRRRLLPKNDRNIIPQN